MYGNLDSQGKFKGFIPSYSKKNTIYKQNLLMENWRSQDFE